MTSIKKLLFVWAAVLLCSTPVAEARPAYPGPVVVTQSDGTQITIRIVGDESYHYVLSQEGYSLVSGSDGDYYYARLSDDGRLVPTSVKARPLGMLTLAQRSEISRIRKGLKPAPQAFSNGQRMRHALAPRGPQAEGGKITPPDRISSAQTIGDLRSLVILVETTDISFVTSSPQSAFTDLLNQEGYSVNGATGSAWDYYHENSNGRFNPEFVVVGPYKLNRSARYYAGSDGTQNAAEMIVDACKAADAAGVDFSQFADNGVIRDIFVFYAGHNQAEGASNTVWPHRYDVTYDGFNESFDGQALQGYACSSELQGWSGRTMTSIGAFCHDFGHVLGWPDFYDTDYDGSGGEAIALEEYSLMCGGSYNNDSRTPPALNILERWMVGWAEPEVLSYSGSYSLGPVWEDKGYLIPTDTENEYFLLENHVSGDSVWDEYLIDYMGQSGMLVYHVDYSSRVARSWEYNTLNNNPNHECMKIVRSRPGSKYEIAQNPGRAFFPGDAGVTTLTTSNSDYRPWYEGIPAVSLTRIELEDRNVRLEVAGQSGGDIPSLNCTVAANQFDALIRWDGTVSEKWNVAWKREGVSLGSQQIEGAAIHINGLAPATQYDVELSPLSGDYTGQTEKISFVTGSISDSARNAYIALTGEEYAASEPVLLSLRNYTGSLARIDWYIDGAEAPATYLRLEPGEHSVMAAAVGTDGKIEYIIKYITVK